MVLGGQSLVLYVPEIGGRCDLLVAPIFNTGRREGGLKLKRVRPGVLGPANPAALAHVEHDPHVRGP